jgi:amino acid permease
MLHAETKTSELSNTMSNKSHEEKSTRVNSDSQYVAEFPQESVDSAVGSSYKVASVRRGLHARHISMIAVGGAIGTGLIIGR